MANIFESAANYVGNWMAGKIAQYLNDDLGTRGNILSNYYQGDHRKPLKVKMDKDGRPIDDNIIQNFVGLAVDRSVSRLFKGGVKWKLPDGAKEQDDYLNKVWDLNKKEIILYQVGLHGAVYGTPYFKICPDEMIDPYTGDLYPRLIPLDPEIVRIKTAPQDMNQIDQYRIEYNYIREREDGGTVEVSYKEITRRSRTDDYAKPKDGTERAGKYWTIEEFEKVGGGQWTLLSKVEWPYDFPPIIHWKNLPSLKSCYGDSDIDDAINVQDKSNFVVSNTSKIIKFHAHPQTIGTGFSVKDMPPPDSAPNTIYSIANENAKVYNLEMQSDLASSLGFGLALRQSIFDISREVDISSIADKLGTLTNFGLQVLWSDATDKNDTKRQLYGDALKELNRRLLVLKGFEMEASNPGDVQWGNPLPVNVLEDLTADEKALGMKIVDIETVANRYESRYGVPYETIKANIANEQAAKTEQDNIGADILRRRFNQGQ